MSDNSIESVLSMISSNPELINKISSAVQAGGDDLSKNLSSVISLISESQHKNAKNEKDAQIFSDYNDEKPDTPVGKFEKTDDFLHLGGTDSILFKLSKSITRNAPLLLALKPYLSKSRCDMIDTAVKISQLSSIMNIAK